MKSHSSTPSERQKAERRVIDTAMRDHMRLRNLGWNGSYFTKGSLTRAHWVACCALAKVLEMGRK